MFNKELDKRPSYFECSRCGYSFVKYRAAKVEKCFICAKPVFEYKLERPFPFVRRSEEEMLRLLDYYSYKKYMWYKYPKFHEEDIRTRDAKYEPELV